MEAGKRTEDASILKQELESLLNKGNYVEALPICERLIDEFKWDSCRLYLPSIYYNLRQYNKIIGVVNKCIEDYSEDPEIMLLFDSEIFLLGEAYIETNNYDMAIECFNKVVTIIRERAKANGIIDLSYDDKLNISVSLVEIGSVYYRRKNFNKAFEYFDKARDNLLTVENCYYVGIMLYHGWGRAKDIVAAEKELSKVLSVKDVSIEMKRTAYYYLGKIYATETGFVNKEKAKEYLKISRSLGCEISDEEFQKLMNANVNNSISTKVSSSITASNNSSSSGCYVATCVYGTYDCSQLWVLRRFRDDILSETSLGRLFIKIYYALSPKIVKSFGDFQWFHNIFKKPLDKLVNHLKKKGIEDTRYNDIEKEV